jgi:hypothetical protein
MQFPGTHTVQLVIEVRNYVIQKMMRRDSMEEDLQAIDLISMAAQHSN